jgi:hypothetical protein
MPLPSLVLSAEQRAWQYWFDDGLPTLVAGVGCLFAALFFAYDRSQNSTHVSIVLGFTGLLVYGVVLLFNREIVDCLKSKITYPRTGFIQPPYFAEEASSSIDLTTLSMLGVDAKRSADIDRLHAYRKQRLLFVCLVIAAGAAAMMFVRSAWVCALAGVAMALALWVWGHKVQRLSWIIIGGFPIIGFYLAVFQAGRLVGPDRITFFLAGAGIVLVLDGALTLFRYLRANPPPAQS